MRRLQNWLSLLFILLWSVKTYAQDFSNKGTDFWVGYGYHVRMNIGSDGGSQQMVLYFATEAITNVTVSIPGLGYTVTYSNIPANTIFTTDPLPKAGSSDARITGEGISSKGIHITSNRPVVAYAHVYDGNVSGATLLFPTNTLGKEYYSVNYRQVANEGESNCWLYAVAVDTGTTMVEITPSANTLTHPARTPFTVTLTQGQVINLMGQMNITNQQPYTGEDLTGSVIKSISTGPGGCKRIAVFSGSGKLSITCDGSSASSDNYMVQAFPRTAWGKRYLTAPTKNFSNNFFRICVADPSTVVRLNGSTLSGLINNFYYEINTTAPALIEADKPVLVAQYITSQGVCGNALTTGDPEVIYLSPVEQNIDRVILNSTPNFAISQHFVNVVIKGSAVPSFRLDGNSISGFTVHPQDPTYSFAQLQVGAGKHTLQADSGFNAIAYGYGEFESYGFNAGTNIKDLYQFISIQNQYATVDFPAACKASPFYFNMTFPYQPNEIKWIFGAQLNAMGLADVTVNSPVYDSTWAINGKQLYRYKLPKPYIISAIGTYPIRVLAQNATAEGCNGEQEINYDLQVFERPSADFNFLSSGCVSDSIQFSDNSSLAGRTSTRWFWNFGDGGTSALHNPAHLYKNAGTFPVKFALVSDIGCLSDTVVKTVILSEPPAAKFGISSPACIGKSISFSDSSFAPTIPIVKWTWDFGDNSSQVISPTGALQLHTYSTTGTYTATLQVENGSGCKSAAYSRQVTVSSNPTADFLFGTACLPNAAVPFTNKSIITDGTQNSLTYTWNFGDGGTATEKDPLHIYNNAGPFATKLIVTSGAGCKDSISKAINTIYGQPEAKFTAPMEACLGTVVNFIDQSSASNSSINTWEWNFGDGSPVSNDQNSTHTFIKAGTYLISLKVTAATGCASEVTSKNLFVNPLPVADFILSSPVCENGNFSFTNTSSPGAGSIVKSVWDFGDGSVPSNQASTTHSYTRAGTYAVSLSVETDKGCKSSLTSKQIVVHPLPKVGFVVPGNCLDDPISTFTDTSSIEDGSQSQFQWLWNFGDPNSSPVNNSATQQNGQHKYTATGDYNVSLTVISKDGCSSSLTQTFTVNGAVPVPLFTVQAGLNFCSNDSIIITDNSFVNPGKPVKLEIYWDYNGDPTNKLVVERPIKGATYKQAYPAFFSPATKTYRVKFVIYSGINCLTEKDTSIVLKAIPEIQFAPIAPVCANESAFQLNVVVANNSSGNGTFTGRGVAANGVFNPANAGPGTHVIRFTYQAANGCTNTQEQAVTVLPVPTVTAGPDKFLLEGGSVVLNGTGTGSILTYSWSPVLYLNNAAISQPVASPTTDITYTLTVETADGCKASDQVFVKVLKTPTVPNAFSPNGDGVHDRWEIEYLDSYPGATVEIFNRYGQKVFESKGYAKPWDGTLNGKALPIGTYYYIIDPKNGRKPITGFVDIIR